jgi:hypothetical protein
MSGEPSVIPSQDGRTVEPEDKNKVNMKSERENLETAKDHLL